MVPARVVLYMLSMSGFLVSFMMRTDINIAMVAMAKTRDPALGVDTDKYCYATPNLTSGNSTSLPEVSCFTLRPFNIASNLIIGKTTTVIDK